MCVCVCVCLNSLRISPHLPISRCIAPPQVVSPGISSVITSTSNSFSLSTPSPRSFTPHFYHHLPLLPTARQVFFWTLGFAGGGLLSVVANGGTGSPARQRLTLGILGGVNLLFTAFFVAFGGGKGAGGKGEDEMKIA